MELRGKAGDTVRLGVTSYEFPDITDDRYDSNWLFVEVSATVRGRSWKSRDPSLLTWEVTWLANWLEALSRGEEREAEVSFLEPNLLFRYCDRIGEDVHLRVYFELESRPRWAPADGASMEDLWAEVEATPAQLQAAAAELRAITERFPSRAGVGTSMDRPGREA